MYVFFGFLESKLLFYNLSTYSKHKAVVSSQHAIYQASGRSKVHLVTDEVWHESELSAASLLTG